MSLSFGLRSLFAELVDLQGGTETQRKKINTLEHVTNESTQLERHRLSIKVIKHTSVDSLMVYSESCNLTTKGSHTISILLPSSHLNPIP